jgi:hypothetical protein
VIFLVANFLAKTIFQLKYSVANSFLVSGKKNCQENEKKKKKGPPKFTTTAYNQFFFVFLWRNFATWLIFFPEKKNRHTHNSFVCDFRKNFAIF